MSNVISCLKCGAEMKNGVHGYFCKCGFSYQCGGYQLSEEDISDLKREGKTKIVAMKNKQGDSFTDSIYFDEQLGKLRPYQYKKEDFVETDKQGTPATYNSLDNDGALINLSQVYESLRFSEYSVENGVGELCDNGVEANAHNLRVDINSEKQKVEGRKKEVNKVTSVCVADDGCGMNKDILRKSLGLGISVRESINGKKGIGRFGVGMTLGSISIGRKVEVYSRDNASDDFFYTYIDLDEISNEVNGMKKIPEPIHKNVPEEYSDFFAKKTGTLVVISNCDRISDDAMDVNSSIANYLGRTYRKFIEGGTNIEFNGVHVYLHDPLYLVGPTQFDFKEEGPDPKATLYDTTTIPLEIPGSAGEMAEVKITLSLLPIEWRRNQGDGDSPENKKRKVDQNEGVSILRANREVLYDKVPYLIGKKGQARYEEKDRFWGCEISFPPELDPYFQVRYIKRGAEPVASLKDKLRDSITKAITELRKTISADWAKEEFNQGKKGGDYGNVEQTVARAESTRTMKSTARGKNLTPAEEEDILNRVVKSITTEKTTEEEKKKEREERKEQIKQKAITLAPVNYPASILFEPQYLLNDRMIININVNHPFYKKFLVPLCGNLEDGDVELSNEKMMARDAIFLLFCSYARATAVHDDPQTNAILEGHLSDIGTFLSVMTREYNGEFKNE